MGSSPHLAHYQPHILPALHDALCGFTKLRCPAQCAQVRHYPVTQRGSPAAYGYSPRLVRVQVRYLRARIWHAVGATEERDRDAAAFHAAEREAAQAASRLPGTLLSYAEPGVLEEHIAELDAFAAAAAQAAASC